MDITSPSQILLSGTLEANEPESMESQVERFSATSAEAGGRVNMTQAVLILGRSKQLVERLVTQLRP